MAGVEQQIRFCRSADGVRLAYATHGRGPTLVKVAHWFTHVEFDWHSPVWEFWWRELGRDHQVLRYDERGCGLSDREPERLSLAAFVEDLEAVVDAAGPERFALMGISQGGATAVRYAVRHPERVSHLVLCNAYSRGRLHRDLDPRQREEVELLQSLVRVGWDAAAPVFRRVFTGLLVPGATPEQMEWLEELMRVSAAPDTAMRIRGAWNDEDVTDLLARVSVPTLVLHSRGDRAVPFEEGRLLAAGIPGARFVPLESENHALLGTEPAWPVFLHELRDFLGEPAPPPVSAASSLTAREREVLGLVAVGMSNDEVGERLSLSPRTVERHLSSVYRKLDLSGKAARAGASAYLARLDQEEHITI